MAPLTTTRKLLEVRVGSMHTLEVLLQIRQGDISWWNSDVYNHERELYKLIGRRIVPDECRDEIKNHALLMKGIRGDNNENHKANKSKERVVIGEDNLKKITATANKGTGRKRGKQTTTASGRGKKLKTDAKKGGGKKQTSTSNATAVFGTGDEDDSEPKEKTHKLLRQKGTWIMGSSIQVCYEMEDIDRSAVRTLIYRPMEQPTTKRDASSTTGEEKEDNIQLSTPPDKGEKVPLATFRRWKKLSKRVNLWVFKFDPDDPYDMSTSEGGGFPRPDLLPLADIFRSNDD